MFELEIYLVIEDIVKVFLIVMLICVLWEDVLDIVFEVFFIFIIFFIELILFMVKRYFVKNVVGGEVKDGVFIDLEDIFKDFYNDLLVLGEIFLNVLFEDNFLFDV